MKLRNLQVKNFRCIEDSTQFTICPMTCLVGKNGAGKTSLLEALYKINPDVQELAGFDVLMEYPRARRREYQKRAETKPDDAVLTTWELDDQDVQKLEGVLGPGAVKSRTIAIRKGYYPARRWAGAIAKSGDLPAPPASVPSEDVEHLREDVKGLTEIAGPTEQVGSGATQGLEEASGRAPVPAEGEGDAFYEKYVGQLLPKLLYFSEWHIMEGRVSIDALLQRRQKGELTGPDRVFLALLQLGGTSVEAISRIERSEELIADLEDAARPVTQEIAKYWSQERDLRISFHLYPGRPQDPSPFDRGLVFETRIVDTRTDLSLNFDERSTGFVWFFSFLVWYSDVRRRYGDNLLILLDDPGLGLHAKAQWDLLRYISERLAPRYQIAYATHSPFMIDPEKMQWVRTVEEIAEDTAAGRSDRIGTKVGDEVLSTDYDTLLPLQASLGYRIMKDLAGNRRLLLVEKPADVIYVNWFSARLSEAGRRGLDSAWTIVPCGDLVRLATLVGLLAHDTTGFAVLLSLSQQDPDVARHRELSRMLTACHVLTLGRYAEPLESTIEDMIGPTTYMALIDLSYRVPRRQRLTRTVEPRTGVPVLKAISEVFAASRPTAASFDPMIPAEYLLRSGSKKLRKLPAINDALARFEKLFADINACF
ncbi:MAG: AAA family ATPase [Sedimentisphaerales bacterium]|nr:AAA family ATPase [Sedimentisphaerales bacterium]